MKKNKEKKNNKKIKEWYEDDYRSFNDYDEDDGFIDEIATYLDLDNPKLLDSGVAEFVGIHYNKEYKKKNSKYYDSKKEMKKFFFSTLSYNLESVIPWVLKNGFKQIPDCQKIKSAIFEQIAGATGPQFTKFIKKAWKNGEYSSDSAVQYLPILLYEIIGDINKKNREIRAKDPNAETYDSSDLYELLMEILNEPVKKLVKKGISESLAIDILSIIPSPKAMKYSGRFRAKMLFTLLYNHARNEEIPFRKIMKIVVTEEYYDDIIFYSLRERKEMYQKFNDKQKALFNDITEWTFDTLSEYDDDIIKDILSRYVADRKRDEKAGKDGNRRYYISSLPESDYKKIHRAVNKIISNDESAKKYL